MPLRPDYASLKSSLLCVPHDFMLGDGRFIFYMFHRAPEFINSHQFQEMPVAVNHFHDLFDTGNFFLLLGSQKGVDSFLVRLHFSANLLLQGLSLLAKSSRQCLVSGFTLLVGLHCQLLHFLEGGVDLVLEKFLFLLQGSDLGISQFQKRLDGLGIFRNGMVDLSPGHILAVFFHSPR